MKFDNLKNQFAKKGHYLEDLGEEKYHNRYRFISIGDCNESGEIKLIRNHVNNLEDLENILEILKTRRIGEYEVKFIKLILNEVPGEEYSDLMTRMEKDFNIPLLNDTEWNEKNKDIINLYKVIGEQRNWEKEDEWELEI